MKEVDDQLVQFFTTYTSNKGRCLDHVQLSGIDKMSNNYKPWTNYKPQYGANYTIKLMENTLINLVIGTVGFTVIEYFGESVLEDKTTGEAYKVPVKHVPDNTYNIVQEVHSRCFTCSGLMHTPLRPHELRKRYNVNVIRHRGVEQDEFQL
jgi:hypothetical protein